MNKELDGPELFLLAAMFCGTLLATLLICNIYAERSMYVKQGCVEIPTYGSSVMIWKCTEPIALPWGSKDAQ